MIPEIILVLEKKYFLYFFRKVYRSCLVSELKMSNFYEIIFEKTSDYFYVKIKKVFIFPEAVQIFFMSSNYFWRRIKKKIIESDIL